MSDDDVPQEGKKLKKDRLKPLRMDLPMGSALHGAMRVPPPEDNDDEETKDLGEEIEGADEGDEVDPDDERPS